jgi:ABC-type transport system substrate-binding protein
MRNTLIFTIILSVLLSACTEINLLKVGVLNKPYSLQSWKIRDGVSTLIGNQIHRGLIRIDPSSGATIPSIAKSWKITPPEGKITFTLDDKALFSDNTKITCADVKKSFERLVALKDETSFTFPKDITFLCDEQLIFSMKMTTIPAMLFDILASPAAAISKADGITGAGPYAVTTQGDNEIVLKKIRGSGPNQISFQIGDQKTLIARFKEHQIDDLLYLGLFLDVKDNNCQILEGLAPTVFWFGINSRIPIFKSIENRKSIQELLDAGVEATGIFSGENRVRGLMPYGMIVGRGVSSTDEFEKKLSKLILNATALVSKYGKIDFFLRESHQEAFNWKILFDKIDPEQKIFNFKFFNNSDFFKCYYDKKIPVFFIGANITRNDPFEVLSFFRKKDYVNPSGVTHDRIDSLMNKSNQAESYDEIRQFAKESSDWIINNGYAAPLYSKRFRGCVSRSLKGYQISPLGPLAIDYSLIERK